MEKKYKFVTYCILLLFACGIFTACSGNDKSNSPPTQHVSNTVQSDETPKKELKNKILHILPEASSIDVSTSSNNTFDVIININKDYDNTESAKHAGRNNIQKIIDANLPTKFERITVIISPKTINSKSKSCMIMYVPAEYAANSKDNFSFIVDGKREDIP